MSSTIASRMNYIPTVIPDVESAKASASFPLWLPRTTPAPLTLSRIRHHWPEWVPRDRPNPRSDFLEVRYTDSNGADLEVLHGFFSRYIGVQPLVPEGMKGTFELDGVTAYWLSARATGVAVVDGRYVPAEWQPGFAAVAWQTGVDEDSRIYFSMSSRSLSVSDLQEIAKSVGPA